MLLPKGKMRQNESLHVADKRHRRPVAALVSGHTPRTKWEEAALGDGLLLEYIDTTLWTFAGWATSIWAGSEVCSGR